MRTPKLLGYRLADKDYCPECSPTNEPRYALWEDSGGLVGVECVTCCEPLDPPRRHSRTCRCAGCDEARACEREDKYDAVRRGEW